ncbi:MAG: hypothetical protein U9Q74_15355, partial [Gemmatimonadota bacterium]|nr:hypothetical protein [Gemmatimonadota bacterium]
MQVNGKLRTVAVLVVAWAFVLGIALGPQPAASFEFDDAIGDLVKIFGIGWAVQQFSGDIDGAINDVLSQRDAEIAGATKVVPILRVGGGGGG